MYTAYVDGNLFYSPNLVEEGFAADILKQSEEVNKVGSFEFSILPDNPVYNDIRLLTSVVTVYDGDEEIFRGRPIEISRGFQNKKVVRCEGWLAVWLDSLARPFSGGGKAKSMYVKYSVDHNNSIGDREKMISRDIIDLPEPDAYVYASTENYLTTWDAINEKLLQSQGGYIRFKRKNGVNCVDYIADYDRISNQVIEFGSNLLSFDEFISTDDLYTAIIPLGARDEETGERLTIESVNDGIDYLIDTEAEALFGRIWHVEFWDDVTIADNLKNKAQKRLAESVSAAVSLEMRAFDLHILNVETESFRIGDRVRVVSLPHGIDDYFMCTRIERDLLRPEQSTFTFGMAYKTLTGQTRSQLRSVAGAIESVITTPPTTEIVYRAASGAYWGDVNNDGNVNSTDITLIQRYMDGEQVTIDTTAVDLNGDGNITQTEADEMIELIEGLQSDKIIVKVISTTSGGTVTNYWQYLDRSADEG